MKHLLVLFLFLAMVGVFAETSISDDCSILVYDNNQGIISLLNGAGLVKGVNYDVWSPTENTAYNTFGVSDFLSLNYKVIITGWNGNYGALATQMQTDMQNNQEWLTMGGRVVLSGQDPDYHKTASGKQFALNALDWVLNGFNAENPTLGFISFSDNVSLWNWTPWINSSVLGHGTATSNGGDAVSIPTGAASHDVNYLLTSANLSNWSSSYHATFSVLPTGFSAISTASNGQAITIINENIPLIVTPEVPEPTSIVMLGLGIFGLWTLRKRF